MSQIWLFTKYENKHFKNSFYNFDYLLEPNIKSGNCFGNLVTVRKLKPFFHFEKNSPNDENLPQIFLFESSNHRFDHQQKGF